MTNSKFAPNIYIYVPLPLDRNQQKDNKDQTLKNLDKALEPISQMIKTLADGLILSFENNMKLIFKSLF